jgi:hypothetical protein
VNVNKQTEDALKMAIEWIQHCRNLLYTLAQEETHTGRVADGLGQHIPRLLASMQEALEQSAGKEFFERGKEIARWADKQAQEPVALTEAVAIVLEGFNIPSDVRKILETAYYTHPHQWQDLTDDEIKELSRNNKCWMNAGGNLMFDWEYFGRAIEQASRNKNGY